MKKVRKLKIHFVVMNLQEYIILLRTPKDWEEFKKKKKKNTYEKSRK